MWKKILEVGRGQLAVIANNGSLVRFEILMEINELLSCPSHCLHSKPPTTTLNTPVQWHSVSTQMETKKIGDTMQMALDQPFPSYLKKVSVCSIIPFNILLKFHTLQKVLWCSHWRNEMDNSTITKNHPFQQPRPTDFEVVQGQAVVKLCTALGVTLCDGLRLSHSS